MNTIEFLRTVVTPNEDDIEANGGNAFFCMAVSNGNGTWLEQWHRWPQDLEAVAARAEAQAEHSNVYFSSYLFKAPQSTKDNVFPSRTIQADLDDADIKTLPLEPTILVETSPNRHQAYWVIPREAGYTSLEEHEALSRRITYSIALCDRSGWPLGRKVRIPNTKNYKYLSGPKQVHVVRAGLKQHAREQFEALPEVPQFMVEHYDLEFLETPTGSAEHALHILERIADNIPTKVYVEYGIAQADRSEALWALLTWAFKAGLSRNEVFSLAKGSANNKFLDRAHRADQDLAKDVLRAEHVVKSNVVDIRQAIQNLTLTAPNPAERKRQTLTLVYANMKAEGEFLHATNGYTWYIRRDVGRPIALTPMSEMLRTLLDIQYGLNATEVEARYVTHGLCSLANALPDTAIQSALSYYDTDQEPPHLLVHTGKKTVLRITATSIETAVDGAHNVIFPWMKSLEAFVPSLSSECDWGDELFGNGLRGYGSSVDNLLNMSPMQAKAMLKVWMLFLLFRHAATARPILATFGQPGSGKTTLFKKLFVLLYGRSKSIGAVTTMDDFDHAVATEPIAVLDNVDTWEKWLPDRLALSAGTSDVTKRKLYTDVDTVVLKRQAMIGITAHNPKFGREDVADRFVLLTYQRLNHFVSEELILADINSKRDVIWGSMLRDAQKVMRQPMPSNSESPQFRIEDFARFGLRIARAIGEEANFRGALTDVKSSQQNFSLEEEGMLVSAVQKFADRPSAQSAADVKHHTASQLWAMLESCADDPRAFAQQYRNAVNLSKKLLAMQDSLRSRVRIEQGMTETGTRTWLIGPKALAGTAQN